MTLFSSILTGLLLGLVLTVAFTALFGVKDIDKALLEMAKTFRMPTDRQIRYIYIPGLTAPFLKNIRVGAPIGLILGIGLYIIF
ncbi:hypothetical protein [Butyrivibrio proteoclasticus]|uniref:hypothetical protein n=1 Tax=Butyrivibrio proteoclasticus TaxID=43305 RepID=UPI00047A504E|nr:hypothetical protein [Butyrivibrio proteoclasticus]